MLGRRRRQDLELLDAGCECAGPSAQITRRRIKGGNLTIHVQCTTCGHSKGTLKVAEVFSAKDLPAWDEEILRRYRATQVTRGPQVRAEIERAEAERRTQVPIGSTRRPSGTPCAPGFTSGPAERARRACRPLPSMSTM